MNPVKQGWIICLRAGKPFNPRSGIQAAAWGPIHRAVGRSRMTGIREKGLLRV
jgi:hypothetical protein